MKQNRIAPPDVFSSHKRASEILETSGCRLVLIEAIVLLIVAAALHMVVIETAVTIADIGMAMGRQAMEEIVYPSMILLLLLLGLLVDLPLFIGFLRLAAEIEATGEGRLTTLFSSFSGARIYRRSLRLAWGYFAWVVLLVVVAILSCAVVAVSLSEQPLLTVAVGGVLVVAELALFLIPMMRAFPTLAIALDLRFSMRATRQRMRLMRERMPVSGWRFFLSWLPRILLGILTFGILLIWDTLPRMAVSYFVQVRRMNEMIIRSEENKEHE